MATQFLLSLNYPLCQFPIGLFKTAESALDFAAEHPPIPGGSLDEGADEELDTRWQLAGMHGFNDLGTESNRKPNGYVITKFDGDRPVANAYVEPYSNHEPTVDDDTPMKIDPEQELDWS